MAGSWPEGRVSRKGTGNRLHQVRDMGKRTVASLSSKISFLVIPQTVTSIGLESETTMGFVGKKDMRVYPLYAEAKKLRKNFRRGQQHKENVYT